MMHHEQLLLTFRRDYIGGEAYIYVNDEPTAVHLSSLNSFAGYKSVVPVKLRLEPGDNNSIRFGASGTEGTS